MERKQGWFIAAILVVDVALLFVAIFGINMFGRQILSFSTASIGIITFLGLFAILFQSGQQIESTMRNAIAGSMIATYLSIVGISTFFALVDSKSHQTLAPLTKATIDSFQTVITVVIGFYFTSSAAVEGIQRLKTGEVQKK